MLAMRMIMLMTKKIVMVGSTLLEYYHNCANDTSMMSVRCPLKGDTINMVHSSFVDDVCSTTATYDNTQLSALASSMSNKFSGSFDKRRFKKIKERPPCWPNHLARAHTQ